MKKFLISVIILIVISSCSGEENVLLTDNDGDGVLTQDEDINGDGDFTNDDTDGDGVANYLDDDDDGDGILTQDEDINDDGDFTNDDTDGDGIVNYLDDDDDNDYILTIDEGPDSDVDCNNVPDYIDMNFNQQINGSWRLVKAGSGFSGGGSYPSSKGIRLNNDTLTYLSRTGFPGSYDTIRYNRYIYKANMDIDGVNYVYNNTEFIGIDNNLNKDTIYSKQFGGLCQSPIGGYLTSNTFGFFYIDDDFVDNEIYYCSSGDFCINQSQDTLKFYSYTHSTNFSGYRRSFEFVRD
ncbi:hypothetical protein [Pseudofulvibacter geojedonensis]|uniref:Thrombospondin type 3 repeat-containing protein n=1 Tax=Pseudofulvibacter geojedonensis TaxID=1123758 RepID=A0ABW3I525_9FLAO